MPGTGRVIFVSFSGIDGAGKSTRIDALRARLTQSGVHVLLLSLWQDIVVLSRLRERTSHAVFKGDKGTGTPASPVYRRDKNVRAWYVTGMRLIFYLLDAVHLRTVVARMMATNANQVVIFDRYIYDELANLPLEHRFARLYIRLLLRFTPKPDIAYLIDADPIAAQHRKPEYPLDFLQGNRLSYLALSDLAGMIVIEPRSILATDEKMTHAVLARMPVLPRLVLSTF